MESLGASEHTDLVAKFIEHPDVVIATQAARTAGRIGDGRAIDELTERYNASSVPALRAAIEVGGRLYRTTIREEDLSSVEYLIATADSSGTAVRRRAVASGIY